MVRMIEQIINENNARANEMEMPKKQQHTEIKTYEVRNASECETAHNNSHLITPSRSQSVRRDNETAFGYSVEAKQKKTKFQRKRQRWEREKKM